MSDSEQAFTEWSQKQIDTLWAERQRLEGENTSLRAQLAEVKQELTLNAGMLARQCDLARQAEAERDQWRSKFELAEARGNRLLDRVELARADRDQWKSRAQAAEAGICKPGCETLVAVETERNAAEARARAYRKCLVDLVANADVNYKPCGCCISPMPALLFEAARQVLLHPEAHGERVQNLEALASAARKVLAVCGVPVLQAMPQSSIELLQELREALDATGKEAKGDD